MFDFISYLQFVESTDAGKIFLFIIAMFLAFLADYITGFYKSIKLKTPSSDTGLVGLLKHLSIFALVLFLTFFCLILGKETIPFIYMFYITYLVTEFQSILENLDQVGLDVKPFQWLIQTVSKDRMIDYDEKQKRK